MTENELSRRVAVLTRFRELLIGQRERFGNYLTVLDKQQSIIDSGSAQDVLSYVELEENIAAGILSIQKVLDPMEVLYQELAVESPADDIPQIKSSLEKLRIQTKEQAGKNRELISARMENIRAEMNELKKNPVLLNSSIYRTSSAAASMIDIRG